MHLRPLALAALLLLAPAPEAAQAAETEPSLPPTADSPASALPPGLPAVEAPADPLPPAEPVDAPDAEGGAPAPEAGSTPPAAPPSPGGHPAPEPGEAPAEPERAGDEPAEERRPGDHRAGTARGTSPGEDADAAHPPTLERASLVGPGTDAAHRPGPGTPGPQDHAAGGQLLAGRQQVAPGTVTRISLGTVTRVPAQGTAGDSVAGWVVGLSALGAGAAVVVARRSRARRAR